MPVSLVVGKQILLCESIDGHNKVIISHDGFIHWNFLSTLLRIFGTNNVWMVLLLQTIKLVMHQSGVEFAIIFDMKKLIGVK